MTMTKTISRNFFLLLFLTLIITAFIGDPAAKQANKIEATPLAEILPTYATHFDFPVGKPDGEGYYNAQVFGKNNHLGDDWNGNGGGDTDFGDTIYSVANGYIQSAENQGSGWGKVIMIKHYMETESNVISLYAHCDKMLVTKANHFIRRSEPIGTIGNADGIYPAHLHFEIRSDTDLGIGGGYSANTSGYLDPTKFIKAHR
ncbi:MAG: peptidoglycan DD-metalloendopeptidase family protein [Crocinitomix sp.]|nr:peptidoglycan DD-metalloendopeptidase family protein [Crocinitomix sp.]